ncbi:MAG: hypothetical protein WBB28_25230 [Crinalium sp.]
MTKQYKPDLRDALDQIEWKLDGTQFVGVGKNNKVAYDCFLKNATFTDEDGDQCIPYEGLITVTSKNDPVGIKLRWEIDEAYIRYTHIK